MSDGEIVALARAGRAGKALPGTGDDEDRDGDGMANVIEYGLSTNPDASSVAPGIATRLNLDGTIQLMISILRDPAKTDVTITVESSGDLWDWAPIAASVNGAPFSGIATISGETSGIAPRLVTIIDPYAAPAGQGRGFLRVRVTR